MSHLEKEGGNEGDESSRLCSRREVLKVGGVGAVAVLLSFVSSCRRIAEVLGKLDDSDEIPPVEEKDKGISPSERVINPAEHKTTTPTSGQGAGINPSIRTVQDTAESDAAIAISEQRARISQLNRESRSSKVNWNNNLIARNLTKGLDESAARRKLFEFVQSFPYQLRHYETDDMTPLYDTESGDCRHKRGALYNLLQARGFEVRKVTVLFDWADLPIPKEILDIKKNSGTRGFHSAMEVKIDGKWTYIDPTWDTGLARLDFPVSENWDGENPTKDITKGRIIKYPHNSYERIDELYSRHNIPWPKMSETIEFNGRLNSWLSRKRVEK